MEELPLEDMALDGNDVGMVGQIVRHGFSSFGSPWEIRLTRFRMPFKPAPWPSRAGLKKRGGV
jgi:hypothetical protein